MLKADLMGNDAQKYLITNDGIVHSASVVKHLKPEELSLERAAKTM